MEEQRQRQQEESRRSGPTSDVPAASAPPSNHEGNRFVLQNSLLDSYSVSRIPIVDSQIILYVEKMPSTDFRLHVTVLCTEPLMLPCNQWELE